MNSILPRLTRLILARGGRYENSKDCIHIWTVYKHRIAVDMVFLAMRIIDDYLPQEQVDALDNLTIGYAKVHWVGAESESVNPLTELVHSTQQYLSEDALGATAWYNVRPVNPVWHNDIMSYNDKYPTDTTPEHTFLYYMRAPETGGHLEIGTGPDLGDVQWIVSDTYEPVPNRLLYFDATLTHRVQPYTGNRVSVGWVWWKITPDKYEKQFINEYKVLERVWK